MNNFKGKIIDISPEISEETAVYPGDEKYKRHVAMDMNEGANLTLSSITTTLHIGAHTDAPNHYHKKGAGMSDRSLDYYFGPCQVVEVKIKRGVRITLQDIQNVEIMAPRVLFKTSSFIHQHKWNTDFNSLSPELINHLAAKNVKLVGIDTPSIDPDDSKALESHQAVFKNDMSILEGVVLTHVEPGQYFLVALPLKLKAADASPVRAVLLKD
jgi:arylformamidase